MIHLAPNKEYTFNTLLTSSAVVAYSIFKEYHTPLIHVECDSTVLSESNLNVAFIPSTESFTVYNESDTVYILQESHLLCYAKSPDGSPLRAEATTSYSSVVIANLSSSMCEVTLSSVNTFKITLEPNQAYFLDNPDNVTFKVTFADVSKNPQASPLALQYPHYYKPTKGQEFVDVYSILSMWNVTDHAIAHAIKKLLAAGQRGAKDKLKDKREAIVSIQRSIEMDDVL